MPNYNITIDSRFDPYSFEDYLKPLAILQEQHNQAADAYANYLSQSAGMEEALAANPDDIDLLNQYNTYRQTLNALADDLSKNGISRATRRGAFQAKADYGNIAKMQEAIKTRDELLKERRGLRAQDNSIIFDTDDDSYSIRNVMAGKTNYNMLSQNTVAKAVSDQVQNLAKTAYDIESNPKIKEKYGYIIEEMRRGVTPKEVQDLIDGIPPTTEFGRDMKGILDRAIADATGVGNWNKSQLDSISDYAKRGLWSAIGDLKTEWHQNWLLKNAMDNASKKSDKAYAGSKWNWMKMLTAKNDTDLWGIDDRQISMATQVADYLNGNIDKMPDYTKGRGNFTANLNDYVKNYLSDKDGNVSDKTKLAACKMIINSGMVNYDQSYVELIPEKYKQTYKNLLENSTKNAKTVAEYDQAKANAIHEVNKLILKDTDVTENDYKKLANDYADHVNKGAVLSEGAFFYAADNPHIYNNVMQILNFPENAAYFKGQNLEGEFVNNLKKPDKGTVDKDRYKKDLLDENGNLKKETQIGFFSDKNGNVAIVMSNGNNSYQFDITNRLKDTFPGAKFLQDGYSALLQDEMMARKIKIKTETGKALTESEKKVLESFKGYGITSPEQIDQAFIDNIKRAAQEVGNKLYDTYYQLFTMEQKNNVGQNGYVMFPKDEKTETEG